MTINVHYSISKLTSSGYTPRMADDRIGYFLTVRKDYNKKSDRDQFIRCDTRRGRHLGDGPFTLCQVIFGVAD